jgi:integrase
VRKLPKGIRRDGNRLRAYVRVGGKQREKRFLLDTPLAIIQAWRADTRQVLRRKAPLAGAVAGTLEADAAKYLRTVTGMPSYRTRRTDLLAWIPLFGARTRDSLEPWELAQAIDRWRTEGSASSTLRHRKIALVQLWKTLDGPDAPCPARSLRIPREDPADARDLGLELAHAIIDEIPDVGRSARFAKRPTTNLTKLRLRVMLTTGLTHLQIGRLAPADFDQAARTLRLTGRKKGRGTPARVLPLTVAGAQAIAALIAGGALGPFSDSSMHKSFRAACRRLEAARAELGQPVALAGARPYDLRHTYATDLYRRSGGDLKAVKEALGHTSWVTSERYTRAGVPEHLARVIGALDAPKAGSETGNTS